MTARSLTTRSLVIAAVVILAACGGGPVSSPTPAGQTAGTTATPVGTPGQPGTPQPTSPPTGGFVDACALVSAAEWATVTGYNVIAAQVLEMSPPSAGCLYITDANPAGATSLSPNGGMWDMVWTASDLPEVAGIGDGAVWEANTAALVVLVGDQILSVNAGSGADELDTRLEWAKALAQIAVGRL